MVTGDVQDGLSVLNSSLSTPGEAHLEEHGLSTLGIPKSHASL